MVWTVDELGSYIQDIWLPGPFTDQVYKGMPLLVRLENRNSIKMDGGQNIRHSVIVDEVPGDSYTGIGNFDTSHVDISSFLQAPWRHKWAGINIIKTDLGKINSKQAAGDYLKTNMQAAEMKMRRLITTGLLSSNTFGAGTEIDGLRLALDDTTNTNNYLGINRSVAPTDKMKGNANYTGGPTSLSMLGDSYDSASINNVYPDLAITTRAILRKIKLLIQPQDRYLREDGRHADLAKIGVMGVEFEGMAIVADDYCPSGFMFGLNTEYMTLFIHEDYHFVMDKKDGWKQPLAGSAYINQLLWWGNLLVKSPRLMFIISSMT